MEHNILFIAASVILESHIPLARFQSPTFPVFALPDGNTEMVWAVTLSEGTRRNLMQFCYWFKTADEMQRLINHLVNPHWPKEADIFQSDCTYDPVGGMA